MFHYRIDVLRLDILKPLVVWLQDPARRDDVPEAQWRRLVGAVESWVVRRALLRRNSKGLNRFVVEQIMRRAAAEPERMGECVEELLAAQTSLISYWPDDAEVRRVLDEEPVYRALSRAPVRMVLEAVEDRHRGYPDGHRRSEAPVVRGTCTIEHLMPQQWRTNWDNGADEEAAARRDRLVHTLGNLTLVTQALNSSLSNGAWEAKRAALDASTGLLTTREVTAHHVHSWTDDDINERTTAVVEDVLAVWPAPEMSRVVDGRKRASDVGTTATGRGGSEDADSEDEWNGRDWYVNIGEHGGTRCWEDAMRYGFVSGGGGNRYSRTLRRLPVGSRVFAYLPGSGYVGVGVVLAEAVRFDQAVVTVDGGERPLRDLPLETSYRHPGDEADDMGEWVVPVRWEHVVGRSDAVRTPGMFANQNTAVKLRQRFTVDALEEAFGLA